MSVTPRPEFGKPETGMARHWFRTDAQMRRHYMDPERRELERQRISARRAQMKEIRENNKRAWEEAERRAKHRHFTCDDCCGGLNDVGAFDGEKDEEPKVDTAESRQCCTCLELIALGDDRLTVPAKPGPHYARIYRCRVFDPEPEEQVDVLV